MKKLQALRFLRGEPWPSHSFQVPLFQAHRGYWKAGARENSLESLIEARRRGFSMAEFDLQRTKDGVLVLNHDQNLSRQIKKNIQLHQLKYEDLKSLLPLTLLQEVFESPETPSFFNIEIKSMKLQKDPIVETLIEFLKERKLEDRVLISSFNPWVLMELKMKAPQLPRALIATEEKDPWNWQYLRELWTAPLLRPHFFHLDHRDLSDERLQEFQERGLSLAAWTVNSKEKSQELLGRGVKSIITDEVLFQ